MSRDAPIFSPERAPRQGALWLVLGTVTGMSLALFAWSMILALGGSFLATWSILEHVVARESERLRDSIGDGIGRALGTHLAERGNVAQIGPRS